MKRSEEKLGELSELLKGTSQQAPPELVWSRVVLEALFWDFVQGETRKSIVRGPMFTHPPFGLLDAEKGTPLLFGDASSWFAL